MDVGGAEAKNHKHAPATTVIRSENVCGEINPFDNISLKLFFARFPTQSSFVIYEKEFSWSFSSPPQTIFRPPE